jgi:hypothetical protein
VHAGETAPSATDGGRAPAGMADIPRAGVAPRGDRAPKGILQGTAFSRRICAGMRHDAGGTPRVISRQDRPTCWFVHQRCSIRVTRPSSRSDGRQTHRGISPLSAKEPRVSRDVCPSAAGASVPGLTSTPERADIGCVRCPLYELIPARMARAVKGYRGNPPTAPVPSPLCRGEAGPDCELCDGAGVVTQLLASKRLDEARPRLDRK